MKLRAKIAYVLASVLVVVSLTASTLLYRGLYNEARQSVVSLEESLDRAHRSLEDATIERDAALSSVVAAREEAGRIEGVTVSVEKEIDKYVSSKRREEVVNDKIVEVVVVEHIGDDLDSLLTKGYEGIYLPKNTE